MSYPRFPVAVHILLLRGEEVLLLRRHNTGFEDGKLSVVAGHVEPGESLIQAALREAGEEAGLRLAPDRLHVVGVMHRRSQEDRVDFFLAYHLEGSGEEPFNREPLKCSELLWVPLTCLPEDTISYVRTGIENFRSGRWFEAFGWPCAVV